MASVQQATWGDIPANAPANEQMAFLQKLLDNPPAGSRVLTITPELAELLVLKNTNNRTVRRAKVSTYAQSMTDGKWHLTGETIKFSKDNHVLLDGQHRLRACIQSGVPFTTHVVFGIPEKFFTNFDTGVKRSNADILHIAMPTVPNYRFAAQAARWMYIYNVQPPANDEDGNPLPDRSLTLENDAFMNFYRRNVNAKQMERATVQTALIHKFHPGIFSPGALAGHFYMYISISEEVYGMLVLDLEDAMRKEARKHRASFAEQLIDQIEYLRDQGRGRLHENEINKLLNYTFNTYKSGKKWRTRIDWTQVGRAFVYPEKAKVIGNSQ